MPERSDGPKGKANELQQQATAAIATAGGKGD